MSRYILIRRLRGPAILLLMGTLALLREMGAISDLWRLFWPLLLIMLGLLMLAERAALASEGYPIWPGAPWQQTPPGQGAANTVANPGTAIVPSPPRDFDREGGQS